MAWFRRFEEVTPPPPPEPDDGPTALRGRLADLIAFVNASAGRLPVAGVVAARRVTDVVGELLDDLGATTTPDVTVTIAVRSMIDDYLPTTLRAFLALDPATVDTSGRTGVSPGDLLVEQLDELWLAALDLLAAVQARDADRLLSQGRFLQAKFRRSDLDL